MENKLDVTGKETAATAVVVQDVKKPRKKYSKGLKGAQRFERRASKAAHKVADAVNDGIKTYMTKRDKSAGKKRDGAILDMYKNMAKGASEALGDASPAIYDFAKAVNVLGMSKKNRKRFKKQIGRFTKFPLMN